MKAAKILFCIGLLGSGLGLCAVAASDWRTSPVFHASTPAGYEVLVVKPSGALLSILGLIECPDLEGVQQIAEGMSARVVNADGQPLSHFPSDFSFRITASLRKTVLVEPTGVINSPEKPQDLLLKLKFQLKAYHGLQMREIQPDSVEMIGVPADIAYDERIYRVRFNVDQLPVTDRCVLEVLLPDGERLTRFHFDLL
jgi:hypothetical protein